MYIHREKVEIATPRDARRHGIETIYQTLALADNLDAPANLFLGRELRTPPGLLDADAMEHEARAVLHRLNPNFKNITDPATNLAGGQPQSVPHPRPPLFHHKHPPPEHPP